MWRSRVFSSREARTIPAVLHRHPYLALLATAVALAASPVHAQFTPEGYEAAVGTGTYLDLTNEVAGTTRHGVTMIWSNYTAGDWDFPDGSDAAEFVNGNSADDKTAGNLPGITPEIDLDFTGLLASTDYDIFLAARFHPVNNDEGGDISWGTTSGNLTLVQYNADTFPAGSGMVDPDSDGDGTLLLKVGMLTSDASGTFSFFVDNGLEFHQNPVDIDPNTIEIGRDRTQFDGILLRGAVAPGDVNGDTVVDGKDFDIIKMNFGNSAVGIMGGDLTLDGIVDFDDFRQWKNNVPGTGAGAVNIGVPEPCGMVLLVSAVVGLGLWRRSVSLRCVDPYPV